MLYAVNIVPAFSFPEDSKYVQFSEDDDPQLILTEIQVYMVKLHKSFHILIMKFCALTIMHILTGTADAEATGTRPFVCATFRSTFCSFKRIKVSNRLTIRHKV